MSSSLEFEAKVILKESDFLRLKSSLGCEGKEYIQVNHYIDTNTFELRKNKVSLRVREKKSFIELTLKTHIPDGGRIETTDIIGREECNALLKGESFPEGQVKTLLENMGYGSLRFILITSLKTKRVDIPYLGGILSIDENQYSGIIDYEIEFEDQSLDSAQLKLKALLESYNIPFVPNKITKTARALMAINK